MKLSFKGYFEEYAPQLLSRCGYHAHRAPHDPSIVSYVRPMAAQGYYPRFHAYLELDSADEIRFSFHLDQKACSYAGTNMHAGEYDPEDSPAVSAEAERLRQAFASFLKK